MSERDTLPCPGCHTPLPPEATGCQICMRARTKQEIMRGYAKLREEKARKRRLPFQIAAAILILGAGGRLIIVYREKLAAAAASATGAAGRWADNMRDPKNYASMNAETPARAPEAAAAVAADAALRPAADVPPSGAHMGSPKTHQTPMDSPKANPAPRPVSKNAWRVSGGVYDLMTLEPVPGAEITFLRNDKEPVIATTDDKGAYGIDLDKGDGWTVNMKVIDRGRGGPDSRYRGMLVDIDPPYRVRDADERRATLEHITDGDLNASQIGWNRASSKVKLDLIAVPQRWNEIPRP